MILTDRQHIPSFVLFLLIFSSLETSALVIHDHDVEQDCLSVPSTVFTSAIRSAIREIETAASFIGKFAAKTFGNFRLQNAVADCSDLLAFSSDELTWALSTTDQNSNTTNHLGTGDRAYDLKSWLSAAMDNLETCVDGFEETKGVVKSIAAHSLSEVSSMISQMLKMVKNRITPNTTTAGVAERFPKWVARGERRLLQAPMAALRVDLTVAQDGSGDFTTVLDAVNAARENSEQRFVIYVKRGVYNENVEVKKKKWNLMLVGDGAAVTIISGNRSFVDGWTTFHTATFAVSGRGFIARDITFENTAGPWKHQTVALRSDSDLSVFYRCNIHGYQDTLYAHSLRQFYKECYISGTVDFIFGNAAAVFQSCNIIARKPLPNQKNSVTAHGRKDPNQNTGFSLQFCNFSADSDLAGSPFSTATYLGRPWKEYSRTVVMQSYLGSVIWREGWLEWFGDFALSSLYYAEYLNFGPGAALGGRVSWPGYHLLSDSSEANNFTVALFIAGNSWLPATGVEYISGLTS